VNACFFVATTFRSGSTLLGKLLFEETGLSFHLEQFNTVPTWFKLKETTLRHTITQALSPVVGGHYGAKLMWPHRNNLATFLDIDRAHSAQFLEVFPNLKFVHLARRDKVAQAVSYYIARRSDNWTTVNNDIEYSFPIILEYFKNLFYHDTMWDEFFRSISVEAKKILYEDMIADTELALSTVLDEFGISRNGSSARYSSFGPWKQSPLSARFRDRFLDDLYTLSPLEFLPGRLIGPFTPK
jgi:LPS sulfotransferase NodH